MKKYFRIAYALFKLNLSTILIYRLNAFLMTMLGMVYIFSRMLVVYFIFDNLVFVEGYNRLEILSLVLLTEFMWLLHMLVTRKSLKVVADSINTGLLDYYLTKPVKFTRIIPVLKPDLRQLLSILPPFGLLIYYLKDLDIGWFRFLGASFYLLNGIVIFHLFISIFVGLTFWSGRNIAIHHFTPEFEDLLWLPRNFFFGVFKWIFTFLIPLSVIINPSFQLLFKRESNGILILALCITILFFIINKIVWKYGLKSYSSAN